MNRHHAIAIALATGVALSNPEAALATAFRDRTPLNLTQPTAAQAGSTGGMLVRTIVALAAVCLAIWILSQVLRRTGHRARRAAGSGQVQAISRATLSKGKDVSVVRIGEKIVVLAEAGGQISVLREMTPQEARDEGLLPDETANAVSAVTVPQALTRAAEWFRGRRAHDSGPLGSGAMTIDDLLEQDA
jgi:flagellar biogenesis protein FliO